MSTEMQNSILSDMEIDAIGEVLNISMGSAATAICNMLDKQVGITTPTVDVKKLKDITYYELEPAMLVKIKYVEGISGANVMVFKQVDIQLMLNQLMGIEGPPSENPEFDEIGMSAACEVMNQMMGASATALSEFLGKPINISTPEASIMTPENTFVNAVGLSPEEDIVSITFDLTIAEIMKSQFMSVMTVSLAKEIVSQFLNATSDEISKGNEQEADVPVEAAATNPAPTNPEPAQPTMPNNAQAGYPGYPPYGYMPNPYQGHGAPLDPNILRQPMNVQNVQFQNFATPVAGGAGTHMPIGGNMELIMNVPLNVSVEIGRTKKKIRDIMEFSQGTVIELEKQAGAPIDVVVNGQLIAKGDVVVIDENFGIRITEILGMQDILNAIETENE